MASYNRVIMMGNLTRDPEHKQLASGQAVCRFGLASNRQFKNRQTGSMVQEVCFIDVDVWGPQAEHCKQYLQKGRAVLVEGRIKLDSWQDNDGTKRSKHTIVADRVTFLGGAAQAEESESESLQGSSDGMMAAKQDVPFVAPKAKAVKKVESTATGEINFKDEAPFEDDLPF